MVTVKGSSERRTTRAALFVGLVVGALSGFVVVVGGASFLGFGAAPAVAATPSQRSQAAEKAFKAHEVAFQNGGASAEDVYIWSYRWFEADRSTNGNAAKEHFSRMKTLEAEVQKKQGAGVATTKDVADCAYYVAEAAELSGRP